MLVSSIMKEIRAVRAQLEALVYPILRHRIVPTINAEAEGISVDEIIRRILEATPKGEAKAVLQTSASDGIQVQ